MPQDQDRLALARSGSLPEAFSAAFGAGSNPLSSAQARRAASDDVEDRLERVSLELLRTQAALSDAERKLASQAPAPSLRAQVDQALKGAQS